jgi:DNA-binding MarR family transcriptional regulator
VRSTRDRRENCLRLTVKGEAALETMLDYTARYERYLARRLTRDERKTLIRLLGKVAKPAQEKSGASHAGTRVKARASRSRRA